MPQFSLCLPPHPQSLILWAPGDVQGKGSWLCKLTARHPIQGLHNTPRASLPTEEEGKQATPPDMALPKSLLPHTSYTWFPLPSHPPSARLGPSTLAWEDPAPWPEPAYRCTRWPP